MDEKELNNLPLNALFGLMFKSINELIMFNKDPQDKLAIQAKENEVALIQKVIVRRKAEFAPVAAL